MSTGVPAWYSRYAGYFAAEIRSVRRIDGMNSAMRRGNPRPVQCTHCPEAATPKR